MVKDNELRGVVLQKFYDLRHQQNLVQLKDVQLNDDQTGRITSNICAQLSDHGLISWESHNSLDEYSFGGIGRITANGVDVIDGEQRSPISIVLHHHDQSITVSSSSNVQVGNANSIQTTLDIQKVMQAIDQSEVSVSEKEEAKSLWSRLTNNAAFAAIVGAVVTMASAAH